MIQVAAQHIKQKIRKYNEKIEMVEACCSFLLANVIETLLYFEWMQRNAQTKTSKALLYCERLYPLEQIHICQTSSNPMFSDNIPTWLRFIF